jgi:predicted CXXCH cytochrome family protein
MRLLFLMTLSLILWTASFAEADPAEGCATGQCHQDVMAAKVRHAPLESCDSCHLPVLTPHPQPKNKTFKLAQEVPVLCEQCHARFGGRKHVHSPVKDGTCLACHDPHASAEPKLLSGPLKDLCSSCHPDKMEFRHLHGPAATGDCTSCHNPHEAKLDNLLVRDGADLCFMCHVDMKSEIKRKFRHPALANGCTSCHNPHGSQAKKFFPSTGTDLCFTCHQTIKKRLASSKSIHGPMKTERGCSTCHASHASDAEKLLPKTGKEFCLDCHKGLIKKDQTVLHGPIKDGKCTPCHDPHASPEEKLLVKKFSSDFYVTYSEAEYQLCFGCHNRDLLRNPATTYATGFRDGNRNLHFIHVNRKDRGKNCTTCHRVHAGENRKLIIDKVPFGEWKLPIKFVQTETGGSCAPGCHKPYRYDRNLQAGQKDRAQPEKK